MPLTLLALCNDARRAVGVSSLQWDERIQHVAQSHADAMAQGAYFDHVDVQGRAVGERLTQSGFNYRWAGENISAGKNRVEEVFAWWMTSAGHRANILKPEFALTGFGYCFIEHDIRAFHHYWVQAFATEMR